MFGLQYVGKEGVENLKNYAYHGVDLSITSKLLQPWWNFFVQLLPLWLAPNLITLIGLGFIISGYLVQVAACGAQLLCPPESTSTIAYLWVAFCIFVYQTLDAVDGKQARRTKSSSPLGELFDHGCDALTSALIALQVASLAHMQAHPLLFPAMIGMLAAFHLAQWEEYHTGILVLGKFSVTEGQIVTMVNFVVPFLFGADFWTVSYSLPGLGWPLSRSDMMALFIVVVLWAIIAVNFFNVAAWCAKEKKMSLGATFPRLVPLAVLVLIYALWYYFPFPGAASERYPHLFLGSAGLINAALVGRMVVYRVCGLVYSPFQPILIVPVAAYLLVSAGVVPELVAIVAVYLFAIASYLVFALTVIEEMTTALGIDCLRIKPVKQ